MFKFMTIAVLGVASTQALKLDMPDVTQLFKEDKPAEDQAP